MEKFAAPLVVIVSVFLYFTHDAGFNFKEAGPEKRAGFVERQSAKAAAHSGFSMRPGPDAVFISADQRLVRLRVRASEALNSGAHRPKMFKRGCEGYSQSYLGAHGITLRLEFFRDSGTMAGTLSLSPGVCAAALARVS